MITKRICIKDIHIKQWLPGYNDIHVKFGEQFECELSASGCGTHCFRINGMETNSWISISDLNKMSVELQDIRNLKLVLLTNDYTNNKRLKKKILMAQKMDDYHSMLKHIAKAERFK